MGTREVKLYYSIQWEPEKFRNITLYNGNQRSLGIIICTMGTREV